MKRWNEIVSAYEAERQVLEAARREYNETAKAIVEDVKAELSRLLPGLDAPPVAPELEVVSDGSGDTGEWVCALRLNAAGVRWAWIGCWVASAYEGPPGVLRVAAHVAPGSSAHLLDPASLVREAGTSLGYTPAAQHPADVDEDDTVGLTSLDLRREDLVEAAAKEMMRLARELAPLVLQWHAAECPARALFRAKAALLEKPLVRKQTITPKGKALGREGATRYLWLDNPKPSVWVGVNLQDGHLYALCDEDGESETLPQSFASALGSRTTTVEEHSAVLLRTKSQMKKMTEEELTTEVLRAFRTFYEVSQRRRLRPLFVRAGSVSGSHSNTNDGAGTMNSTRSARPRAKAPRRAAVGGNAPVLGAAAGPITLPAKQAGRIRLACLSWAVSAGAGTQPAADFLHTLASLSPQLADVDLVVAAGLSVVGSITPAAVIEGAGGKPVLFELEVGGGRPWVTAVNPQAPFSVLRSRQLVYTKPQRATKGRRAMARLSAALHRGEGSIWFQRVDFPLILMICGENNALRTGTGGSPFHFAPRKGVPPAPFDRPWALLNVAHVPYWPHALPTGFAKVGQVQMKKGPVGPTLERAVGGVVCRDGRQTAGALVHVNNVLGSQPGTNAFAALGWAKGPLRLSRIGGVRSGAGASPGWQATIYEISETPRSAPAARSGAGPR